MAPSKFHDEEPIMNVGRLIAITAALAGYAIPGAAQQQAPGVVIQTETRLVLVDTVVTDKKGTYVHDLTQKDFRVWEDNKEQQIKSFSFEADPNSPLHNEKHYLVLLFDNSTLQFSDQVQARRAASGFIDSNAGPGRMIAIVNYIGGLQIAQNFTENPERLKQVVNGVKFAAVNPNDTVPGSPRLTRAAADFAARDLILALRSLSKDLSSVPGRKIVVLLTAGFPVTPEQISEVTATIDACNKANVAIYPIDVRGLVAPVPRATAPLLNLGGFAFGFQRGGTGGGIGSGGGTVSGGRGGSTGSTGGGNAGTAPGRGGSGGAAPAPPARTGTAPTGNPGANPGNQGRGGGVPPGGLVNPLGIGPYNQSRELIPKFPESVTTNQQLMFMLADGTGGFVIHDTNDLLSGLQKIAQEQNEYYILGYTPPDSAEGSCHVLRVKVDRGGTTVRARTGYCNAKPHDLLAGNPIEKQLETRISASQAGTLPAKVQLPFFYSSPGVSRVNLAMEIDSKNLEFEKQKGKFHADINVLGIAYTPDGTVGARFSDTMKLDFPDKKDVEKFKEKSLHYENQFEVASGTYTLKLVFSSGGGSFGKVELPLTVDPYDSDQFALSGLALSKAAVRASDAALDASLIEDKVPLIAGGVQVIPAGSNQFAKGETALFYFEVYEPLLVSPDPEKPPAVAIQMRVLERASGQPKVDTGLMRLELPKDSGSPVIRVAERMPVANLGPGAYILEITAEDTAGKIVKRAADFDMN
jgi:VWFA-related protein